MFYICLIIIIVYLIFIYDQNTKYRHITHMFIELDLLRYKFLDTSQFILDNNLIKIPKIIHKIFIQHSGTLPEFPIKDKYINDAHQSWVKTNPEYTIKYWCLNDIRTYLIKNHPREYIDTFDCIQAYAGKTDFFRYIIVHDMGGWYSDWKQSCLVESALNYMATNRNDIFFWDFAGSYKVQNNFFGACKFNKLLNNIIKQCIIITRNKDYSTGPTYVCGVGLLYKIYKYTNHESYIEPSNYFISNHLFYNNQKVIRHKCKKCYKNQYWKDGNDYTKLWKSGKYYC